MRTRTTPPVLLALAALALFASTLFAAPPEAMSPPRRAKATPVEHTDTPRTLAAAYYSLRSGLDATLMLSNQGPHPMPVEIRLFSLAGEPFDLPPVTLAGKELRAFHLRALVPPGSAFEEGSLQVSFRGKNLELGGLLNLTDAAHSLIFDEELFEPAITFASSRLEGVWWLPSRNAKVRLVVSNTTDQPLVATVSVDGVTPKPAAPGEIALQPHATRVLRLDELAGGPVRSLARVGGVSIAHTGPRGGLLARVLIEKPSMGYSDAVELFDPAKIESTKLDGAGLRIGLAGGSPLTQALVARNVGSRNLKLDGRIPYLTESGREGVVHLPTVRLAPGEIREIGIAAALQKGGVASAASAGLELEHTGAPGSLVASALAVSADGTQVFRVPLRDAALSSSTGIYPWSLDSGATAVVYIKNATDQPRDYSMNLSFPGGIYVFPLQTVAAGQTVALDLRALRDRQVPDVYGTTIPRWVTAGKAQWSMSGLVQHTLVGRIEQVDLARGTSFTAACGACCPNSTLDAWIDPSFVSGFPGGTTQFRAWTVEEDCFGSQQPWHPAWAFFTSTNTSVATVTWDGFATAVGSGRTLIQTDFQGVEYINCAAEAGNDEYCCDSRPLVIPCEAECQVKPTVKIVFDGSGVPLRNGNTGINSVTMKAEADFIGGSYQWSTTSNKVTLSNATSEVVTVTAVSASAQENDVVIKVTFTNEGGSATDQRAITVQKPTSMTFVSYGTANNDPETCAAGTQGKIKDINWQIKDQFDKDQKAAMSLSSTMPISQNGCLLTLTGVDSATTPATGIWPHHYHFCTGRCPCSTTGTQKYVVNGFGIDLPFTFACSGITVAGK